MTTEQFPAGIYPFWFWNGRLSREEIARQVTEMAAKGVRGFYIHPRQGLEQPYLSESFFEMVDAAVEAAELHRLEVNFYDEYPYPSGIAGGAVVLGRPKFSATRLVLVNESIDGGIVRRVLPHGQVLHCSVYPEDGGIDWNRGRNLAESIGMHFGVESYHETGLTSYNRKRYFASEPAPVIEARLPEGRFRLIAAVQVEVEDFKYWKRNVDVLNPEAMREFIALTHEKYRQRYSRHFGSRIRSIFTDEISPGWSDGLPDAFQREYGYDLLAAVPALAEETHPEHRRIKADLERLKYRLFCETFEKPVARWCHENGLAYAGEKPCARFSQFRWMDVPGIDAGHAKTGGDLELLHPDLRHNARAVASAAYFYEKAECLCEGYHSLGWSATLNDARWIADGLLLMGINRLVPHGFFYTTHALKKHDAPPSFFFQMPYWIFFGHLAERVDRIGKKFSGTHIDAHIFVVDPASGLPGKEELAIYRELLESLAARHLDFHIVDTDVLESGTMDGGRLRVREVTADIVVIPPMAVMEDPLRNWLELFQSNGGKVLHWNPDPHDAQLNQLESDVPPELRVVSAETGDRPKSVYLVTRVGQGRTIWFLLNMSGECLALELSCGSPLREVPLDDQLPPLLRLSGGRFTRTFAPFEAVLLEKTPELEAEPEVPSVIAKIEAKARVRLLTPNLVRLGEWTMSLVNSGDGDSPSVRVPAIPLINQLEKGQFQIVPEYRRAFGLTPELVFPRLSVRYETVFELACDAAVHLVMEPDSLVGNWTLHVNDHVLTEDDFRDTDIHVRGSTGVEITAFLRPGANLLRVELETDRQDGGLRNPIYLAGMFAVHLEPLRLVPLTEQGAFEEYSANGLPHFSGVLEYVSTFQLAEIPDAAEVLLELDYPFPFHEPAEVSINGSQTVASPWPPRRVFIATEHLCQGRNEVATVVYTSLCRAFEGQWFDYKAHCYRNSGESAL